MTYKHKLLINFTSLFAVFTLLLLGYQYNRERQYKREVVESRLRGYTDLVAGAAQAAQSDDHHVYLPRLRSLLPPDLRLTIISPTGTVLYESGGHTTRGMANHRTRPEVAAALLQGEGSDVRFSDTESRTLFYFAKAYKPFVVRVAMPYDASLKALMRADYWFLWFMLMVFAVVLVALIFISDKFGKSVTGLRNFIRAADRGLVDYDHLEFPHSELGDIGRAITRQYRQLEDRNREIDRQRERLSRHFHYLEGGIGLFSAEGDMQYANPRFMQYVNAILDRPTPDLNRLWQAQAFAPAQEFRTLHSGSRPLTEAAPVFRYTLRAGSMTCAVQLLMYADGGGEMTLYDVTASEKTKLLKQQMSNNITHELRTPVSSIRGYLETILECPQLTLERMRLFAQKALAQTLRLTDLIRDVALISKMEEAPQLIPTETLRPAEVMAGIADDLHDALQAASMQLVCDIPANLTMQGNVSLVYALFRNLTENSIRYAGPHTEVRVNCYNATPDCLYFSFSDTGRGVPEEHLPRLFERFYRVDKGRSRKMGGTGLGLAIVKNAVLLHGGTIRVSNLPEGGLKFEFTIKK